jgi:hypothetical protein
LADLFRVVTFLRSEKVITYTVITSINSVIKEGSRTMYFAKKLQVQGKESYDVV